VRRELDEKGRNQVTPVLFVDVSEIKVEISHRGLAGIAYGFDILDDCGTGKRQATQLSSTERVSGPQTKEPSFQSQLYKKDAVRQWTSTVRERGTRFPRVQRSDEEPDDFHSL
jgi:hypothetical protein